MEGERKERNSETGEIKRRKGERRKKERRGEGKES